MTLIDTALFDPAEIEALRPRETLSITEWVPQNRYIAEGPAEGQWSNDSFPLQTAIMEAVASSHWSTVVVTASPQRGKTDAAIINPMLYFLFHLHVNCLYVMPSLDKCKALYETKIGRAIANSESLSHQLLDREHGGTTSLRHYLCGRSLHMAGASSAGALASITVPKVFADEVDEFEPDVGGRGHPSDQAFKRTNAFPPSQRSQVEASTVTTTDGRIWRRWLAGTQFVPLVPCIECGTYQLLSRNGAESSPRDDVVASTLVFDESTALNERDGVHMRCGGCERAMPQTELPVMLSRFRWVGAGQSVDTDGTVVGTLPPTRVASFWYSAFYWPWDEWEALANEYVESRGDPDKEREFQIHIDVIPWEDAEQDADRLTPEIVATHATDVHKYQTVPVAADLVTLTADVHDRFIYYDARAWRKDDGESWLVDAGTIGVHGPKKQEKLTEDEKRSRVGHAIEAALDELFAMEAEGWKIVGTPDVRMNAKVVLIDGGYRNDAVGYFCHLRGQRKWRMTRGFDGARPIVPKTFSRNRKGYHEWHIGVDSSKHKLRDLLRTPRGQSGYWHTYADRDLKSYHRHLSSEEWVPVQRAGREKMMWLKRKDSGPNHWWDCEVLQVAAAMMSRVSFPGTKIAVKRTEWFKNRRKAAV